MGTTIYSAPRTQPIPAAVVKLLPEVLQQELGKRRERGAVEEIRLRRDRCVCLTTSEGTVCLQTVLDGQAMDQLVHTLCDGSLYAHRDTIAAGYISLPDGVRVGICGRAAVENGQILGVYDIAALNIRIPGRFRRVGAPVCQMLRRMQGLCGVLIYAPPGEGKTTLLRGVAAEMAGGEMPWRVAVIDTRGELSFSLEDSRLSIDLLTGYPRETGIEIATRTMNAQLIVCDEIGSGKEAESILAAQNCGVPFVASAHADSLQGLLRRSGIRLLHQAHVFGAYVGIHRKVGGGDFTYTVTDWEGADDLL